MIIQPPQFSSIEVPYDKVLARLGYSRDTTRIDAATGDIIGEEIESGKKLINAHQAIASSPVVITGEDTLTLEPGLVIRSKKLYELLKDCAWAYGFAVTVGPHLEEKRNQYLNIRETARALILDAIGSTATEELAEQTQAAIAREAHESGCAATRRFSPGYGDWGLENQREFLRWLGAANIGIRLTDKFQMLPEKSVSAILGIRKL